MLQMMKLSHVAPDYCVCDTPYTSPCVTIDENPSTLNVYSYICWIFKSHFSLTFLSSYLSYLDGCGNDYICGIRKSYLDGLGNDYICGVCQSYLDGRGNDYICGVR